VSDLETQLEAIPEPTDLLRLTTADATPEALARVMARQGGRMTLASPEGGELFALAGGRYSDGRSNFEILLKGHAGERVVSDRVTSEGVLIEKACLTIALTVQPLVLEDLARDRNGYRGRGLLGRFLYALPPGRIGYRKIRPASIPSTLLAEYDRAARSLLAVAGARNAHGCFTANAIALSSDASRVFDAWCAEVEALQRPGERLCEIPDWASKLPGATLRIAALLHAAERPSVDPETRELSDSTLANAVTVGRYLIPHALAAYALMGADNPIEAGGRRVLKWIRDRRLTRFSVRDCFNSLRRSFNDKVENLFPVIEDLVERHYLREVTTVAAGGPGRRTSPVFEVRPGAQNPHNPQNSTA
jgi:hypothetical protein